ncbi:hypothetical protein JCM19301_3451 [Jejuia pallidilutea]|uniref:Uncharacterized protein n=1 Tax=Jejuia pallidilutea TaxID=504487 RepID=A0A090VM14_9FLAO|nr:hypothetical protein JCM19301_3451 [Jejuia pallidilutea]GAL72452.1 hypothetical protein JCM19302_1574 [Jejuia pallidilutea]GAL88574.1 hypothetical protein JCM19538_3087 [Jejuia pallidilutea]
MYEIFINRYTIRADKDNFLRLVFKQRLALCCYILNKYVLV